MARKPAIPLITDFNNIPEEALVPEAEQPFEIPSHWKWVQLKSISTLLSGRDEPLSACNNEGSGIPYIMGASNFSEDSIMVERWIQRPTVVSEEGSLLITVKGTVGKLYIQQEPRLNLSRQVMAIVPMPILDVHYLKYYIQQEVAKVQNQAIGIIPGISRKVLLSLPIPLPPLEEQIAIVPTLEHRLGDIDRSTDAAEAFISDYDQHVEALIRAGVSGELTADWRMEHGYSRNEWTQTTLGEAFKWSSGGTPSRKHAEYYDGTIPWVKSGELPNGVITETAEQITEEAVKNSSAKVFPAGSVLIAMYGATIGQVGILDMDAATNQAIAATQSSPHTLNEYLFYFLQASKDEFIALGKGGAQPNISQTVIKSFRYAIPPLDEQNLIIERLKANLQNYQEAKSKIEAALKLLDHTKENLVMAGLSGKLV